MSLTPIRFGHLDTRPLRLAEVTRSHVPVADQFADKVEQYYQENEPFRKLVDTADQAGLNIVATGRSFRSPGAEETEPGTLSITLSVRDKETRKAPVADFMSGNGHSDVRSDNLEKVFGKMMDTFSDTISMVLSKLGARGS